MKNKQPLPIVIDNQEQKPWSFSPAIVTSRASLPTGDYTLVGWEDRLCIERKSLGDFVNTVTHDWLRFRKQLIRMSGMDMACIAVEGSIDDIMAKRYETEANPESLLGRANGIYLDHGIPVFWWHSHAHAAHMAERLLLLTAVKMNYERPEQV